VNAHAIAERAPETVFTQWHNPTKDTQRVVLHGPRGRFAFVLKPGETLPLDSVYDRAIQVINCGREECQRRPAGGFYCNAGHDGQVVGGAAPLLKRVGKSDRLHHNLDPLLVEKKAAEEKVSAEALLAQGADRTAIVAAARLKEIEAEIAARDEAAKPQAPEPAKPSAPANPKTK
jgi:hypothetical protein